MRVFKDFRSQCSEGLGYLYDLVGGTPLYPSSTFRSTMPRATINNCYQKCKKQGYYELKVAATRVLLIDSDMEIFSSFITHENIWSYQKKNLCKKKFHSNPNQNEADLLESCAQNWPRSSRSRTVRPFLAFCAAYWAWYYSLMVVPLCKGLLGLHKSIGYGDRKSWGSTSL